MKFIDEKNLDFDFETVPNKTRKPYLVRYETEDDDYDDDCDY
jgi:hypothetical protein